MRYYFFMPAPRMVHLAPIVVRDLYPCPPSNRPSESNPTGVQHESCRRTCPSSRLHSGWPNCYMVPKSAFSFQTEGYSGERRCGNRAALSDDGGGAKETHS